MTPVPDQQVRKGLFSKLSDSLETRRTTVVPDVEEFFQRERAWLTKTLPTVQAFDQAFHELIFSSQSEENNLLFWNSFSQARVRENNFLFWNTKGTDGGRMIIMHLCDPGMHIAINSYLS